MILCIALVTSESSKQEWLDVEIAQGPVRGHLDETGELYEFYNIPYATVPTGENKFKVCL